LILEKILVDALVQWAIWGGSQKNAAAAKSVDRVKRVGLFDLPTGVGFKFPIETALQKINPIEIPKPARVKNRVVMGLE
jgi:hypothetical protein